MDLKEFKLLPTTAQSATYEELKRKQMVFKAQMGHRCSEDVKINWKLWEDLIKRLKILYKEKTELDRLLQYLTFKMKCAAHQEDAGWKVDMDLVDSSIQTLTRQQEEKTRDLAAVMPMRKIYTTKSMPKVMYKKDGLPSALGEKWFALMDSLGLDRTHIEGVEVFTRAEEANPNSSDQVKEWLFSLGWNP